ncbi:hypothetical protein Tco_0930619 [Tanacetum coccineum]
MEVEPFNQTQIEDLGLNTCIHDLFPSSKEISSFDEPEPQSQPLSSYPSLDISLEDERGLETPIKLHNPDSFRMKVVDNLTIHTPPSPHVASFHPKDVYCYHPPCIEDLKQHYGFKPGRYGVSMPASPKTTKERRSIRRIQKMSIRRIKDICMTRSSTNELFTPYKEPEREFRSSRRHFKTLSLDELRSPDFNLLFDQEYSEEEEAEAMAETMEQYMSKT